MELLLKAHPEGAKAKDDVRPRASPPLLPRLPVPHPHGARLASPRPPSLRRGRVLPTRRGRAWR
eukprot:5727369-Prymnesium_polylepis.1